VWGRIDISIGIEGECTLSPAVFSLSRVRYPRRTHTLYTHFYWPNSHFDTRVLLAQQPLFRAQATDHHQYALFYKENPFFYTVTCFSFHLVPIFSLFSFCLFNYLIFLILFLIKPAYILFPLSLYTKTYELTYTITNTTTLTKYSNVIFCIVTLRHLSPYVSLV
jgi:hypothetical protein